MIEATKKMFQNYANFNGRTSRRDFWLALLGWYILVLVVAFACGFIGGLIGNNAPVFLVVLLVIASVLPVLAVQVRRLHDINKSGLWYLISFVPCIGAIILLVFYCSKSVDENNNY